METTIRGIGSTALALASLISGLALATATAQAQDPYEPNDTMASATGPLLVNQSYVGSLETQTDKDFFFFYVAAVGGAQTTLTVQNLGGGPSQISEVDARILDSFGAYADGDFVYLGKGASKTATVTLQPGKYFVEVLTREGAGDSYRLTTGGGVGAFVAYDSIASRCATASAIVKTRRAKFENARSKLQRAKGRVQRSRYGSPKARQAARSIRAKAQARFAARRRALQAATRMQQPWCFIPQ